MKRRKINRKQRHCMCLTKTVQKQPRLQWHQTRGHATDVEFPKSKSQFFTQASRLFPPNGFGLWFQVDCTRAGVKVCLVKPMVVNVPDREIRCHLVALHSLFLPSLASTNHGSSSGLSASQTFVTGDTRFQKCCRRSEQIYSVLTIRAK